MASIIEFADIGDDAAILMVDLVVATVCVDEAGALVVTWVSSDSTVECGSAAFEAAGDTADGACAESVRFVSWVVAADDLDIVEVAVPATNGRNASCALG